MTYAMRLHSDVRRMQFAPLESYIVNQLTDKKEAAKLKLESPLGVAERFLDNYRYLMARPHTLVAYGLMH